MNIKKIFSIFIVSLLIFVTACTNKDEKHYTNDTQEKVKEETKIIETNGAAKTKLNLNFGVGKLNVSGNEDKLMKGNFIYSKEEWRPKIKYNVKNKEGELTISQPSLKNGNISLNNKRNEWNINLNEKMPMHINLNLGVGESKVNLTEINLKELNVNMGVGKLDLDISGDYKNNVKVDIKGGVGEATVYVPKSIGVKVKAEKGLGEVNANGFIVEDRDIYKNSQYGKSENTIEINIKTGVGAINIKEK
ncbi:hypothetical protein NRP93_001920 [Clostridium botulinum]|nr:hypothetical protein [Clostridium botulinum]